MNRVICISSVSQRRGMHELHLRIIRNKTIVLNNQLEKRELFIQLELKILKSLCTLYFKAIIWSLKRGKWRVETKSSLL